MRNRIALATLGSASVADYGLAPQPMLKRDHTGSDDAERRVMERAKAKRERRAGKRPA